MSRLVPNFNKICIDTDIEEIFQKIDDKTILVKSGYKIEYMEKYYDVKLKNDRIKNI